MENAGMSTAIPQKIPLQDSRKRKRQRVPLEQRQRAPVACASCRRLKEKCDGSIPCQRCKRYKRECQAVPHSGGGEADLRDDRIASAGRIQDLETIARHYLGNVPLSDDHLRRAVLSLESGSDTLPISQEIEELTLVQEPFTVKTLSHSVAHYSGELSHWNFSQRVREQVQRRLQDATSTGTQETSGNVLEYWRANHLQSRSTTVNKVMGSLPPKHVAAFLTNIYFKYAQTNTFFVEEAWIMKKLDVLYSKSDDLCSDDAAWLCTTMGVLAVGTEFAHMAENPFQAMNTQGDAGDDAAVAAGVSFYRIAAELIPDVITIASVESVQAFLLLAHYTLPLDTAGLAYTYLGLALKMAVQNGMHRKYSGDLHPALVDLRNRLWWTSYRLEKRVSILHGRPSSIASTEIDAEYPSDQTPGVTHLSRVLENAMTKVTDWLGDISVIIHMLRRSPKRLRRAYFERMMQVRQQYSHWWLDANLPVPTTSRAVAHIHMSHHLNLVFLGRPFMFQPHGASNRKHTVRTKIAELVRDAVRSAEEIINIASHLQASVGLAKASYVEFSSCRAAILVLLAQSLNEPCRELRVKLTEGMALIKHMAPANASTKSEASVMAAIEAAIKQLDSYEGLSVGGDLVGTHDNFSSFIEWASGIQDGKGDGLPSSVADGISTASARASGIKGTFAEVGWSPLDVSILDGETGCSDVLDSYHFEDAFSIAHAGSELFGLPSTW